MEVFKILSDLTLSAALLQELDAAFQKWEGFLQKVDKEVDQVAGPNKSTLSSEDSKCSKLQHEVQSIRKVYARHANIGRCGIA